MHTRFVRGKRVFVILRDGTSYVDVFVTRTDDHRFVKLDKHGLVRIKMIRSMSINKGGDRDA